MLGNYWFARFADVFRSQQPSCSMPPGMFDPRSAILEIVGKILLSQVMRRIDMGSGAKKTGLRCQLSIFEPPIAGDQASAAPAWGCNRTHPHIAGRQQACHTKIMDGADFSTPKRLRVGIIIAIILIHIAMIAGLIRAFAPGIASQVVDKMAGAFTVTITSPPPQPEPEPAPPEKEGAAAPVGKKAKPKKETAPEPKVVVAKKLAPKVASTGNDVRSGAGDEGEGTGAGGEGQGTGSGRGGDGQGGGGAARAVKIAGDINSARDYPKKSREQRLGDHVIVALTVGADGRVKNCRVHRASQDPEADRITCQLATQRFRFKPATDRRGRAVQSVFGWQQRWFKPGKN